MNKALLAVGVAAAISSSVSAQEIEEITVTGSRIRITDGMTTPIPVTAITTDELNSYNAGATLAEQLDFLPQTFNTSSAQRGINGQNPVGGVFYTSATGSYIDLRGLGSNRSLVLLDGARVTPADKYGSVNIDTLPTALVKSVDIVTGGASASYGADAMGGVVNLVLDREFTGLDVSMGVGENEFGDGFKSNVSIAGGFEFGNTNVIASFQTNSIDAINRDASELGDWYQNYGWVGGTTYADVCSTAFSPYGLITGIPGLENHVFTADGSDVRPFEFGPVVAGSAMAGGSECDAYSNAFDTGLKGNEVEQNNAFVGVKHEFSDNLTVTGQVMYGQSVSSWKSDRGIALLMAGWAPTIYRDNAYLPDSVRNAMDSAGVTSFKVQKHGAFRGDNEPGAFQYNGADFETLDWGVGIEYELPNAWTLSAKYNSGTADKVSTVDGEIRADRMALAIDSVFDQNGNIVCNVQNYNPTNEQLAASVAGRLESYGAQPGGGPLLSPIGLDDSVNSCVPWNVFGAGNASDAVMDYLHTPKWAVSELQQDFAEILLEGDTNWFDFALGMSYRDQEISDVTYPLDIDRLGPPLNAPELGIRGLGGSYERGSANLHMASTTPRIFGSFDVTEYFGEVRVPVTDDITATGAYRISDYGNNTIDSWKLGVDYTVNNMIRLRATQSRDVREANFRERGDAQNGPGRITDPWTGVTYTATRITAGNPDLNTEVADTTVIGAVLTTDRFQTSVDWFNIEIEDSITQLGPQRVVNNCFAGLTEFCANLDGDPGSIFQIRDKFYNAAQAKVRGVDVESRYQFTDSLSAKILSSWLLERSDTSPSGAVFDIAGQLGTPKFTTVATLNYTIAAWDFELQQRYIDSVNYRNDWTEGVQVDDNKLSSFTMTNFAIRMNVDNYTLSFNVNNLFDRDPVTIPRTETRRVGSQLISPNYDMFGRRYMLGINLSF